MFAVKATVAAWAMCITYESHLYDTRESVEEIVYQMIDRFDRWVKNRPVRSPSEAIRTDSTRK
jgi:hypothetical protein